MVRKIEVLGTGCAKCKRLEKNVREAVAELGADVEIVKIDDFDEIVKRGIMITPGLVLDGEIVAAGRVPGIEEIKGMITRE